MASLVTVELPLEAGQRRDKILEAAKACNAYALLLTEQLEDSVRMLLESEVGTRSWRFPVKRHGDVYVLDQPGYKDNTESIGVRWKAN